MVKLMKYITYIAAVLFIFSGLLMLLTNYAGGLPPQFRMIMGIIFILYGFYRIAVTIHKSRNSGEENEVD